MPALMSLNHFQSFGRLFFFHNDPFLFRAFHPTPPPPPPFFFSSSFFTVKLLPFCSLQRFNQKYFACVNSLMRRGLKVVYWVYQTQLTDVKIQLQTKHAYTHSKKKKNPHKKINEQHFFFVPAGFERQAVLWEQEPKGVRVVSPHLGPQWRRHGQPGGPDLRTHAVAAGQADCLLWGAAGHSHGGQCSALDRVLLFLRWHFSVSVAEFLCQSVSHDTCLLQCIFLSFLLAFLFGSVCVCVNACMICCLAPFYSVSIILIHNLYFALCAGEGDLGVEKLRSHWHHLCLGDIISVSALPRWLALLVWKLACVHQ